MRKLSREKEKRIIEDILAGLTYRETGQKEMVEISTVHRVVKDERRRTPDFDELQDTSIAMRKMNLSPLDVKKAAALSEALNELGIPLQKLEEYIDLLKLILSERNTESDDILNNAMRLKQIEKETGKTAEEILKTLEEALKKDEKRKNEIAVNKKTLRKVKSAKRKANTELQKLNSEIQKTTATLTGVRTLGIEKLGRLVKFIQEFESLGFNAEEVKKLATWRKELQQLGIDPDKLGQWIAERGPLQKQNQLLKTKNEQITATNISKISTNIHLTERNTTLLNINEILIRKILPIPCKGCGTPISVPLPTKKEIQEMTKENLMRPATCPRCDLQQYFTGWDFLFILGMLVAPEGDTIIRIPAETQ
jgi:DNA-binding transcriptional MerR regulator